MLLRCCGVLCCVVLLLCGCVEALKRCRVVVHVCCCGVCLVLGSFVVMPLFCGFGVLL